MRHELRSDLANYPNNLLWCHCKIAFQFQLFVYKYPIAADRLPCRAFYLSHICNSIHFFLRNGFDRPSHGQGSHLFHQIFIKKAQKLWFVGFFDHFRTQQQDAIPNNITSDLKIGGQTLLTFIHSRLLDKGPNVKISTVSWNPCRGLEAQKGWVWYFLQISGLWWINVFT